MRLRGYWRAFVVSLCALGALGAATLLFAPAYAGVFLCALYCIPSNSVFPIPHEPGVLFFAKYYDPLLIGAAATLGSIVASFSDYAMVGALLDRSRLGRRTRESWLLRWGTRWLKKSPFLVVVVFSFVPLPISVVRVLAPASGYPIGRYIAAQIVGRFPRFVVLGVIGRAFDLPAWLLVTATLALAASTMLGRAEDAEDETEDAVTEPAHPAAGQQA